MGINSFYLIGSAPDKLASLSVEELNINEKGTQLGTVAGQPIYILMKIIYGKLFGGSKCNTITG